jgi:hypothetical protein
LERTAPISGPEPGLDRVPKDLWIVTIKQPSVLDIGSGLVSSVRSHPRRRSKHESLNDQWVALVEGRHRLGG